MGTSWPALVVARRHLFLECRQWHQLANYQHHWGWVRSLSVSPDGSRLLRGGGWCHSHLEYFAPLVSLHCALIDPMSGWIFAIWVEGLKMTGILEMPVILSPLRVHPKLPVQNDFTLSPVDR